MQRITALVLAVALMAGCAGRNSGVKEEYVEIPNPAGAFTSNAPETVWVPRRYVEKGVPRGGDLVKEGYHAIKGDKAPETKAPEPKAPEPKAPEPKAAEPRAPEPRAPEPRAPEAAPAGLTSPGGKPAKMYQHFGLVVAVDQGRVYFNLGKEAGVVQGQKLKVYRGGTVVEGLGLAPGALVGTIEVEGFVGTNGGYGTLKEGGPVLKNDLIGVE